jgi:hypothetical protein
VATPAVRGVYRVQSGKTEAHRTVILDAAEITTLPQPPPAELREPPVRAGAGSVDVSSEAAFVLILLLALELGLRLYRGARPRPIDAEQPVR